MTLTLIKIGGSLITDKTREKSFRAEVMRRLAQEIRQALAEHPQQLLVGHGSGSFGHFAAKRHGTIHGVHTPQAWLGFAEVAAAAAELNHNVTQSLREVGVPAWSIQPSASVRSANGTISTMALHPVQTALENGLVPVVYGDVALDDVLGGTITSTETIFSYLAPRLTASRILLLGEVAGVYDQHGNVTDEITPGNFEQLASALGGSAGTDVTGGMLSKVQDMLTLATAVPGLQIIIMDGTQPERLLRAITGHDVPGTRIHAS